MCRNLVRFRHQNDLVKLGKAKKVYFGFSHRTQTPGLLGQTPAFSRPLY